MLWLHRVLNGSLCVEVNHLRERWHHYFQVLALSTHQRLQWQLPRRRVQSGRQQAELPVGFDAAAYLHFLMDALEWEGRASVAR